MGYRGHNGMTDHEFIRATQVERRESQLAHDCAWKIELGLDEQRSVVKIRLSAWEVAEMGQEQQLAAYETSWPNASVQSFTCCLFNAAVRLTRLIEDTRRDEALIGAKRQ